MVFLLRNGINQASGWQEDQEDEHICNLTVSGQSWSLPLLVTWQAVNCIYAVVGLSVLLHWPWGIQSTGDEIFDTVIDSVVANALLPTNSWDFRSFWLSEPPVLFAFLFLLLKFIYRTPLTQLERLALRNAHDATFHFCDVRGKSGSCNSGFSPTLKSLP